MIQNEVRNQIRPHTMPHLILLGDSILDNGAYTAGGPDVLAQARLCLPPDWRCDLLAVDGSTTADIADQLTRPPAQATHLLLSVGGNNALLNVDVLDRPVASSGAGFLLLAEVAAAFETAYRATILACLAHGLPLVVCTIYGGNFADPAYQRTAGLALTVFNDVIIRTAIDHRLRVIDLRLICDTPADYANPIEPSSIGGAKIAQAIARAVTEPAHAGRGAHLVGL